MANTTSDVTPKQGSCLCGSVNVSAQKRDASTGACHCSMCQKWAGGPFMAVDCGSEVEFTGKEHIRVFDSSEWAERGFCTLCGSHLFYRLKQNQQYLIPPGIFDDGAEYDFDHQVFYDEKPNWYDFANNTKNMTGAEVFAYFAEQPTEPPQ